MALSRRGQARLDLEGVEFEIVEHSVPALLGQRIPRPLTRRPRPAFASVSMQSGAGATSPSGSSRHVPAFTVASAVESKPLNLEGVPQWRITAGNLAAGATAGCAVEAGEQGLDDAGSSSRVLGAGAMLLGPANPVAMKS
jgi:hypothetical protein